MALVEASDELVKDGLLGNNLGRFIGPTQSTYVGIDAYDDSIVSMKLGVCFVVVEHSRPDVLASIFATLDTSWEEFIEKLNTSARPKNSNRALKKVSRWLLLPLPACCRRQSRPIRICHNPEICQPYICR